MKCKIKKSYSLVVYLIKNEKNLKKGKNDEMELTEDRESKMHNEISN